MVMLISDQVDFRTRNITKNKEGYFIIMKRLVCQEDMPIIKAYRPKNRVSIYMKQNLTSLKGKIHKSISTVGDLTLLSQ